MKCGLCLINTNYEFLSWRIYGQVWKDFPQISLDPSKKKKRKKVHFQQRLIWYSYNANAN